MIKKLLAIFGIGVAQLAASDDLLFLKALSQVESGDNDLARSKSGARGRYQIMPSTWKQHTKENFSGAYDPVIATRIALKHIAWLRRELTRQLEEEESSPDEKVHYIQIAMAWKAGLSYRYRVSTAGDMDFAVRVISLFNDLKYNRDP